MNIDQLHNRDLRAIIEVARSLGDLHDGPQFEAAVLPLLARLVPAEIIAFNIIDLVARTALRPAVYPTDAYFENGNEILGAYAHQNPLIGAHRSDAIRMSDYLTMRELHKLDIYNLIYKPTSVEYQMAFTIPAPDGRVIGFSFNRSMHDFTERDRSVLNLIRSFVEQSYARVTTRPQPLMAECLGLTERQAQVLAHVARGESSAQIALAMQISERTVHKHLEAVYARLGVATRTAAVARAYRLIESAD